MRRGREVSSEAPGKRTESGRKAQLSADTLGFVAHVLELDFNAVAMVALYLDDAVFGGAAGATEPLEALGKRGKRIVVARHTYDHGHCFAAASLAIPGDAQVVVLRCGCACVGGSVCRAAAHILRPLASFADGDAPDPGGIDDVPFL